MISAYSMKINNKKMKKLEKEYTIIKTKEQEEMVELRVSICVHMLVWRQYRLLSDLNVLKMNSHISEAKI